MQKKPISRYIFAGTALRFLQDASEGSKYKGDEFLQGNIETFLEYLDEFDLLVTQRAAHELRDFLANAEDWDEDYRLTSKQASELRRTVNILRETLFAEASGKIAFIVSDKRIHVDKLLDEVGSLFAPRVFDKLPNVARYDFDEGAKCIAFERTTAGAFHFLRGIEAVLREYYCQKVKRNRADLMWGPMLDSLRNRRKPPSAALLDHLDHIRRNFRNPTQHPEKIYDIQEVQDLFSLCVDVVNRMISEDQ
jgi:hypothetical protein